MSQTLRKFQKVYNKHKIKSWYILIATVSDETPLGNEISGKIWKKSAFPGSSGVNRSAKKAKQQIAKKEYTEVGQNTAHASLPVLPLLSPEIPPGPAHLSSKSLLTFPTLCTWQSLMAFFASLGGGNLKLGSCFHQMKSSCHTHLDVCRVPINSATQRVDDKHMLMESKELPRHLSIEEGRLE